MAATAGTGTGKVTVRNARMTDAKALGAFLTRAWREAGPGALGFTGASEDAIRDISSADFLVKKINDPNLRMIVADAGGDIVGFASIRAEGPRAAELSGIVVLQSASGSGIGTRLIQRTFRLAAGLGFKTMVVRTEVFNERAIGFYKRNGFTESATATEKVGRMKVPVQVLRKAIPEQAPGLATGARARFSRPAG